ncbi:outer membrane protein [Helicobacter heilmannii]|uniref:outer membrane protein n=1 Tax=Helicobacter heilmannii TaxID=35817 RepID=UPI0006A1E350|nr:outer membrane protein [Helicobacter heilmannii]CRF45099.1 putative Outer membrane protein [Helicobacter heilmannii]
MIFGKTPTSFTIPQNTYFTLSSSADPNSNSPFPTANLSASDLTNPKDLKQANTLLNDFFLNIFNIGVSNDSSTNNTGFDVFDQGINSNYNQAYYNNLYKIFGTLQSTGDALLSAFSGAKAGATGLAGNLYDINTLLGKGNALITDNKGSYSADTNSLNTLRILSNINTDFNGELVSDSHGNYSLNANFANVVKMLAPTNSKGNTTNTAFVQNLNTIANNILNTSTSTLKGTTPSNVASLNAVLSALEQSDTSTLNTFINPNNTQAVQKAYTAVKTELGTLQTDLGFSGKTALAETFNAALDLSAQLGYLQNGYNNPINLNGNQLASYKGDQALYTALSQGTINATALNNVLNAPEGSNLLTEVSKLGQYLNSWDPGETSSNTMTPNSQGTNPSSTTLYPQGSTLGSWITMSLYNQQAQALANNTDTAMLLGPLMNLSAQATQLQSMLSSQVKLSDIMNNAINFGFNYDNITQIPQNTLNALRAAQYSENLLSSYLNSIGIGQTPVKTLTPTAKLALYEFNQALSAPTTGLIAETKAALKQDLSQSAYQEFLNNPNDISQQASQIATAAFNVGKLGLVGDLSLDGGLGNLLTSMLQDNKVNVAQYFGFANAAINTLAQTFSPMVSSNNGYTPPQVGVAMADLLNNFSTLSTGNLSAMLKDLNTLNTAVQNIATSDSSFNNGNVITSTSSLNPNGIKSTNATSYINALLGVSNQGGQNMVLAQSPTEQAADALNALMQNLNPSEQNASGVIDLIEDLNTYEHNNTLLNTLVGSSNTATIDSDILAYAQSLPLFQTLMGLKSEQASETGDVRALQTLINRYNYLTTLQSKAKSLLANNQPSQIPTASKTAPLTPGAQQPTSQNNNQGGQQGQQGQTTGNNNNPQGNSQGQQGQINSGTGGSGGQQGQTPNNNPQDNSQGQQGQNQNNNQGTQTASNSLQNLINSIVDNELQNIQQLQSAMNHYFNQEAQIITQTTSAIINSLDNVSATQAVQNIVAGLENYASDPSNNLVGNPEIPQGFKTEVAHFIQNMQAQDIDLELMQLNLDSLINQASQMRVELLDNLANAINPQNLSSLASLIALPASFTQLEPAQLQDSTQAQNTKQAIQGLNNLLIYLNAAKNKMAAYAKESPEVFLNRAGNIGLPNQTTNSNANMYGIDVQVGYKQFFGKKRRWGLRYYGSFSYQRGVFYNRNISSLNDFVYGAGVDALYNFYESKDSKYTTGVFLGFMLAGSSWVDPHYNTLHTEMGYINAAGGKAQMHTSYFQIPLNLGFRTNVTKHHGFEIGLRIPLAVNYYFRGSLDGAHLETTYKRNVAVYVNYVYNF